MNLANRLKTIRNKVNLSQQKFADAIGSKISPIKSIEAEKQQTIPADLVEKIKTKFGVNSNWLLTGKGEMYENNQKEDSDYKYVEITELPFFPNGIPFELAEKWSKGEDLPGPKIKAVKSQLADGELVVNINNVDISKFCQQVKFMYIRQTYLDHDGQVMLYKHNNEIKCGEIFYGQNNNYLIKPLTKNEDDFEASENDITLLGKASKAYINF